MRRRSESTMNAAVTMETCPDSETLAAFSDGALDPKVRLEVLRHVADCGQCQHELVELAAAKRELKLEPANVTRGSFGRWIAPLAAAAAVVLVLFGVPSIRERILGGDPMVKLVQAANQAPKRSTKARLSGGFAYREHQSFRGGGETNENTPIDEETARLAIDAAAADAADQAMKKPSPAYLHADGVGKLLQKTPAVALPVLQEAAKDDPRSAAILTDLSAAYYATGNYEQALATATKAWQIKQTPEAAWNRALALDTLNRKSEAIEAWDKYLELDPSSEWAEEARTKHLAYLRPQG